MSSSVNDIKNELDALLNNSTWWKRFVGSQFVSFLALFLAQIVARCSQVAESALQNSFLSLATRRAAILAGAEEKGYVVAKASPSTGTVKVFNKHTERITIPSNSQVVAENQVIYALSDSLDIGAGEEITGFPLTQVEVLTISTVVQESKSWLSVVLPSEYSEQIHKLVVRVNGEVWQFSYKFRNTNAESKVYMEYYKSTDQYGIRFGNGQNGQSPQAGDNIEVDMWLTEGETILLDGQSLSLAENQGFSFPTDKLEVVTDTQITGGSATEDIESIRNGALYFENYDEQIVWDGDYKAYIKASMGSIIWLSVWGEAEQEKLTGKKDLANVNTIFISAYAKDVDDETLTKNIIALFDGREGYNEKYTGAQRVDAPVTVAVTGYVYSSSVPSDVEEAVETALKKAFGKDVTGKGALLKKDIWAEIEKLVTAQGIDAFEVVVTGLIDDLPINTYQYLDMKNSTVSFRYR